MKELSIEQKAQAYDKVSAEVRAFFEGNQKIPSDVTQALEHLFPEVKEGVQKSEDEKVRKWLIAQLQIKKGDNAILDGMIHKAIDWLEKQGPKFKCGDILIEDCEHTVYKVEDATKDTYSLRRLCENDILQIDTDYMDETARLWDITKDAKDGDILVADGNPFIFKGFLDPTHPKCPVAYCGIDCRDEFRVGSGKDWWAESARPATKSQRNLLFRKMEAAGYKWDSIYKNLENR